MTSTIQTTQSKASNITHESVLKPDKRSKPSHRRRALAIYRVGNGTLLLSALALLTTLFVAYTHHHLFSMVTQIAAHIGMMLAAGTLKLGYVMRLNGLRNLHFNHS